MGGMATGVGIGRIFKAPLPCPPPLLKERRQHPIRPMLNYVTTILWFGGERGYDRVYQKHSLPDLDSADNNKE